MGAENVAKATLEPVATTLQECAPPAQTPAPPPEFRGFGAVSEGLSDNRRGQRKTGSLLARALRKGWVKDEQREKAVEASEWMIDTGRQVADGQLVNFGVRGILAAEANDLKRMEFEDKAERLDNGLATENHAHALSVVIEPVREPPK